jgi:hypothetical protein
MVDAVALGTRSIRQHISSLERNLAEGLRNVTRKQVAVGAAGLVIVAGGLFAYSHLSDSHRQVSIKPVEAAPRLEQAAKLPQTMRFGADFKSGQELMMTAGRNKNDLGIFVGIGSELAHSLGIMHDGPDATNPVAKAATRPWTIIMGRMKITEPQTSAKDARR